MALYHPKVPWARLPGKILFACALYALYMIGHYSISGYLSANRLWSQSRSTPAQCRQLFLHQVKLMRSNPNHPFVQQMNMSPGSLQGRQPKRSDLVFCERYLSPANVGCQLRSSTIDIMMSCYQKYSAEYRRGYQDLQKNPIQSDSQKSETVIDTTLPDYTKDLEGKKTSTNNVIIEDADLLHANSEPVNSSNCDKAYQHMFKMLSSSKDLAKLENKSAVLNNWQSESERKKFNQRCLKVFTPSDLGCIINARDNTVLQACLLVIAG